MGAIRSSAFLAPDLNKIERVPSRDGFGKGLADAARKDQRIVGLCADLTDSTRIEWFKKEFPDRFVELGVAEQNLATVAAGMALGGKIPFISSYATFSPGRNWEQIRTTICYNDVPVKIIGSHAGISVGPDGATHQALEDMGMMRALPNMQVCCPADWIEARKATLAMAELPSPCYMRLSREKVPTITTEQTPFKWGRGEVYRDGYDIAIISCGQLVYEALLAADMLAKDGIDAYVVNMHTIKPIDAELIIDLAKKTGAIVTAEEHQINTGLGSAVAEVIVQNYPVPQKMVAIQDRFGESGEPAELLTKFGLRKEDIIKAAKEAVKLRR